MDDAYRWLARYTDGTVLREYEDDGTEHGFADVDQARLASFELLPRSGPPVILVPSEDVRPFFFRRRRIALGPDGAEQGRSTVTILGYRVTEGGHERAGYIGLYEDGTARISDRDDY